MNQEDQLREYFYDNIDQLREKYGTCAELAIFGDYHNPRVVPAEEVDEDEKESMYL